jgi:hypothetical protein
MKLRIVSIVAVLALTAAAGVTAWASYSAPRQYYTGWNKSPKQSYYYRDYYYKPADDYAGYKHQYVMYYPEKPKHYYYYNPYKKAYWGRCPVQTYGKGQYSELAEKDRKASLSDIPEEAFPAPGAMPHVPGATDGVAMDLPPDNLPPEGSPAETP